MKRVLFLGLLVLLSGCEREAPPAAPEITVVAPVPAVSGTYEFRTGNPSDRDAPSARWFYADLVAGPSGLQAIAWRPDRQTIHVTRAVWTGTDLLMDVERTVELEGEEQLERWTLRAPYSFGDPTFRGPCTITWPGRTLQEEVVGQRVKVSKGSEEEAYDQRESEQTLQPQLPDGEEPVHEDPYYAKEHMGGHTGVGDKPAGKPSGGKQ